MNKAKESNKGSFLDEGFHGTKALVGSLAYFNFGTESESLNLDYLFVCRLSPNMVVRLEICQKIYTTEDFRVKNLHRKRVIFDIC